MQIKPAIKTDLDILALIEKKINKRFIKVANVKFNHCGYTLDEDNYITSIGFFECWIKDITLIIDELISLPHLKKLKLYDNLILDITPIENLKGLISLNLYSNQIENITPLKALKELEALRLHSNRISDISPLSDLKKLEDLELHNNLIVDITPLSRLVNLRELNLSFNEIDDISPLKNLIQLEFLKLRNNKISDLRPLRKLIKLKEIIIDDNPVTIPPMETIEKGIEAIRVYFEKEINNAPKETEHSNYSTQNLFTEFRNRLKSECYEDDFEILDKFIKREYFFEAPERNEDFFNFILRIIQTDTLDYHIIEYILSFFSGLTEKHDLLKGNIEKIIILDNDKKVKLFIHKIIVNDKSFFILIRYPEPLYSIECIFIIEALKKCGFTPHPSFKSINYPYEFSTEIEKKRGSNLFQYLSKEKDILNLINIAQQSNKYNPIILDYSSKIANPSLWPSVLRLLSGNFTNIESIFIETEENYLSISLTDQKRYNIIRLLNLKTIIPEETFHQLDVTIRKVIHDSLDRNIQYIHLDDASEESGRSAFHPVAAGSNKQLIRITNIRYIQTIAYFVTNENIYELNDYGISLIDEIAFSHGARHAEIYRIEKRNHTIEQIRERFSFHQIENIFSNNIKEEIIHYLANEVEFFKFSENGIEFLNEPVELKFDNAVKELCILHIAESIFLPKLSAEHEFENDHELIHQVGFLYTKGYLRGFFHGIFNYIRREPITGCYEFGIYLKCNYKGIRDNTLVFSIVFKGYSDKNYLIEEENEMRFKDYIILAYTNEKKMHIYNTRYIWTIRRLTSFMGNSDEIFDDDRFKLETIAFSHGADDWQSYREYFSTSKEMSASLKNLNEFFSISNVLKYDIIMENELFYRIQIRESIFLPRLPTIKYSIPTTLENKQMHRIGFLYTKNYILGFLSGYSSGYRKGFSDSFSSGFYKVDTLLGCYYTGYQNNAFTFIVCPKEEVKPDVKFDNNMLLNYPLQ